MYTADINSHTEDEFTTLHIAVNEDHFGIAEMVLNNHNADLDAKTKSLRTPLHIAAMRGRTELAKLLINRGANINL